MTAIYPESGACKALLQRMMGAYRRASKARRERQWALKLAVQEELRAEKRALARRRNPWD